MKHIKTFESKELVLTRVDFTGGGDGVYALYIDGELYKYGDYYHDKIEIWIDSFYDGIKYTGTKVRLEKVVCNNSELIERISELADTPPKNLKDINETY